MPPESPQSSERQGLGRTGIQVSQLGEPLERGHPALTELTFYEVAALEAAFRRVMGSVMILPCGRNDLLLSAW